MIPMNRLPAEFEPQQAILLTWPKNIETWPNQLEKVEQAYSTWVSQIIDHQDLYLLEIVPMKLHGTTFDLPHRKGFCSLLYNRESLAPWQKTSITRLLYSA